MANRADAEGVAGRLFEALEPWHGVEPLADILAGVRARVPDARLLIVGGGPERDSLRRRPMDAGCGEALWSSRERWHLRT